MRQRHAVTLTTNDYSQVQDLLSERIGERSTYAWLLRRKLCSATVTSPTEVGADVAISGRRIRFQTGEARSEERRLSWGSPDEESGTLLSLLTPRGLALLGMTVGQSVSIPSYSGRSATFLLESVCEDRNAGQLPQISNRIDSFAEAGAVDPRALHSHRCRVTHRESHADNHEKTA